MGTSVNIVKLNVKLTGCFSNSATKDMLEIKRKNISHGF